MAAKSLMIDYDNKATDEDIKLAESIARQFIGAIEAPPVQIPIGSVNKVFRVEAAGKSHIIRLTQSNHRMGEYDKEYWCAQKARAAGVPTPKVTRVGQIGDAAFMIQEFVEGMPGSDDSVDKMQLWETLGRYVAKIHSIPTQGRGLELNDPDANKFSESWTKHVEHNIDCINPNDILLALGYVSEAEHEVMRECFIAIRQNEWRFGLTHGDLSFRNTIVDLAGQLVLIDWGCASSTVVPYYEFAMILKSVQPTPEQFELFFQSDGWELSEFEQEMAAVSQMLLLSSTDTLRWAIDKKVVARKRYIASLRWALDAHLGRIDWFADRYHEGYGLDKIL